VPRFLAVYGLAGYAIFLAGAILEILGHNAGGVALSIRGGLFEIAFGILLIAKGLPEAQSSDYEKLARNAPPARTTPSTAPTP
jgi:sulfite exporter TauE/SafE